MISSLSPVVYTFAFVCPALLTALSALVLAGSRPMPENSPPGGVKSEPGGRLCHACLHGFNSIIGNLVIDIWQPAASSREALWESEFRPRDRRRFQPATVAFNPDPKRA